MIGVGHVKRLLNHVFAKHGLILDHQHMFSVCFQPQGARRIARSDCQSPGQFPHDPGCKFCKKTLRCGVECI